MHAEQALDKNVKIVIRTDASIRIGSGHLMRCLTLAGRLQQRGCTVLFVCRELPGNLCGLVEEKGYALHRLPHNGTLRDDQKYTKTNTRCCAGWLGVEWEADAVQTLSVLKANEPADWIIVDHYALDRRWELAIRPHAKNIMVIDDLADRSHDCDLLLDQNLYENMDGRYSGLVPDHCLKLLGPRYALLRPEFMAVRKKMRVRTGSVRRILIFLGGTDPTNETGKALEAIRSLDRPDIAVDVIVGASNPHKDGIRSLCAALPKCNYHCQVNNMAEMMAQADLAIGAGGSSTWERCFLGLPAVTIVVAKNQARTTAAVAKRGALTNAGWHESVSPSDIAVALEDLLSSEPARIRMSRNAVDVMGSVADDEDVVVKAICGRAHARS